MLKTNILHGSKINIRGNTMFNDYKAEIFDLNKDNIEMFSELISEAFLSDDAAQKEGTTIVFDAMMLRRLFGSPYLKGQFFVKVTYVGSGDIVGFMGGLPRDLVINEKDLTKTIRVMVPSWAAVHPDHKRKGVGSLLVSKFIEGFKERCFTHAYAIFEPEQHGKDLGSATANRNKGVKTIKWFDINWFIIRIFDIPAVRKVMKLKFYERWIIRLISPPRIKKIKPMKTGNLVRLYKPEDKNTIFELLDEYRSTKDASIIKDRDDFNWYMDQPGIICCVHENNKGKVDGFVLAWKFNFAGFRNIIPFGWVDLINMDHLSKRSAVNLIHLLNFKAKEAGWKGIQTPYIPYFPITPMLKANFLPFPKKMFVQVFGLDNADLSFCKKTPSSCFLDWR